MATPKKKPASPASDAGEGAGAVPGRQARSGTRIHHDRLLTPAERKERQARRKDEAAAREKAQEAARSSQPRKGSFAARRRAR